MWQIRKSLPTMSISRDDASKAAAEWMPILEEWLTCAIMDPGQHRDIGKVLAQAAEIIGVKRLDELSGRKNKLVVGQSYDSIAEAEGDKPRVRAQIKFRMDAWHFETTRRNSKKNEGTNSTGHVAYRKDEFDMLTIFKPSPTFGITGSTIRCIPVSALINKEKPDQLVTSIPAAIRRVYDNDAKTLEVIKELYQTHP